LKKASQPDLVHHPKHYNSDPSGLECILFTGDLESCLSNALKYVWRAGGKDSTLQELNKAQVYHNWAIDMLCEHFHTDGVRKLEEETFDYLVKEVDKPFSVPVRVIAHLIAEANEKLSHLLTPVTHEYLDAILEKSPDTVSKLRGRLSSAGHLTPISEAALHTLLRSTDGVSPGVVKLAASLRHMAPAPLQELLNLTVSRTRPYCWKVVKYLSLHTGLDTRQSVLLSLMCIKALTLTESSNKDLPWVRDCCAKLAARVRYGLHLLVEASQRTT